MSGSMTVLVTVGNVIGVSVAVPFVTETRRLGWIIPVAIQFIPAIGIIAMVPFCPGAFVSRYAIFEKMTLTPNRIPSMACVQGA